MPRASCNEWKNYTSNSSLFRVSPSGGCEFKVYCDMCLGEGEGWIVIQRRSSGEIPFHEKNWEDYKKGFGHSLGEYWMGLEKIHDLTRSGNYELYLGFQKGGLFSKDDHSVVYTGFSVGGASTNYKLSLSGMDQNRSSTRDYLQRHNGQPFTTYDRDNDGVGRVNCAEHSGLMFGGWWFGGGDIAHHSKINHCLDSNLNGKYYDLGYDRGHGNGIKWKAVQPFSTSLVKTIMAIRRVT